MNPIQLEHGLMHLRLRNTAARPVLVCYTYPKTKHLRMPFNICMKQLPAGGVLDLARVSGTTIEYSDLRAFQPVGEVQ